MLSELASLSRSLQDAGVELPGFQRGIVTPGRANPCLRCRLDSAGAIVALEVVAPDDWPSWTHQDGNQNKFPVVNVTEPLLNTSGAKGLAVWTQLGFTADGRAVKGFRMPPEPAVRRLLLDAAQTFPNRQFSTKTYADWSRLEAKAAKLLTIWNGEEYLEHVLELIRRFLLLVSAGQLDGIAQQLRQAAEVSLRSGAEGLTDPLRLLLLGKAPSMDGSNATAKANVLLALDLANSTARIYDRQTRQAIEAIRVVTGDLTREEGCAFGSPGPLRTEPFPAPQIPVVGAKGMALVSMFQEAGCNQRYGLTGSRIVPVGSQFADLLATALLWATAAHRRDKTWRPIASGRVDRRGGKSTEQRDLLIAYVDGRPDLDEQVVGLFGSDTDVLLEEYVSQTRSLCEALRGIAKSVPSAKLCVLVLRQASPGQTQLVLSESYEVTRILEGVRWWTSALRNATSLPIPISVERGKPSIWSTHVQITPEEFVRATSWQWVRGGTERIGCAGLGLKDVLDLMLRPERREELAQRTLRVILGAQLPLLAGLAGSVRLHDPQRMRRADGRELYPPYARSAALVGVAQLGMVLFALGSRKENYMEESPFLVGKMFALADDLHRCYCVVVRKGSTPPALLGNALLSAALSNPSRALSILAERIRVYVGWAKSAEGSRSPSDGQPQRKKSDNPRDIAIATAKSRLRQYESVAQQLQACGLPPVMNDCAKAHLLLGYLAPTANPKEDTDES